jgi:hypothetical protein
MPTTTEVMRHLGAFFTHHGSRQGASESPLTPTTPKRTGYGVWRGPKQFEVSVKVRVSENNSVFNLYIASSTMQV